MKKKSEKKGSKPNILQLKYTTENQCVMNFMKTRNSQDANSNSEQQQEEKKTTSRFRKLM